jgi:hypothetical protein
VSVGPVTLTHQQDSPHPDVPHGALPVAPVVQTRSLHGTRYVVVACPFCGTEHTHLHPGNLSEPVGVRPAACRPGALYRPEVTR